MWLVTRADFVGLSEVEVSFVLAKVFFFFKIQSESCGCRTLWEVLINAVDTATVWTTESSILRVVAVKLKASNKHSDFVFYFFCLRVHTWSTKRYSSASKHWRSSTFRGQAIINIIISLKSPRPSLFLWPFQCVAVRLLKSCFNILRGHHQPVVRW